MILIYQGRGNKTGRGENWEMKLLLVNEIGEQVACVHDVERYSVQDSSSVFAMLDLLESLVAAAKDGKPEEGTQELVFATGSAGQPCLMTCENRIQRAGGTTDCHLVDGRRH